MKTTTKEELAKAYVTLYPDELISPNNTPEQCMEQIIETLGNWLNHYHVAPERVIRSSNWYGKVTKALFLALKIKRPKTVNDMLDSLK